MSIRRPLVVLLIALGLGAGACSAAEGQGGVEVSDAWARPSPEGGASSVYFQLVNDGSRLDRLRGGETDLAQTVEMHQTSMQGDLAVMMPVAVVDVPAGESVTFAPGGYHMMLIGLTAPLEPGDIVPLTLFFERAGQVQIAVEVREP